MLAYKRAKQMCHMENKLLCGTCPNKPALIRQGFFMVSESSDRRH